MQNKSDLGKILLVGAFMILTMVSLNSATAQTFINSGECHNFTYQEATFNETSNETTIQNVTETFCAVNNASTFCVINETLTPGETFSKVDSACNINIKAEVDHELFEHEIPILIDADSNFIRVTVDTDTKSFPRDTGVFQYSANRVVQCPFQESPGNETIRPSTLNQCLEILDRTTGLTSEEREAYNLCQTERDNFKVEWENRGTEITNLNQQLATRTEEKETIEGDLSSANTTNWVLLAFLLIALLVLIIFIVAKVRGRNSDASNMN